MHNTRPSSSWLAICFIVLALTGCGQAPTKPGAVTKPSEPAKVETPPSVERPQSTPAVIPGMGDRERNADDELLIYAKHFGELSVENQKKEYNQVMQSLSRNKKDFFNRLKAALIYSLPNSRLRDNARAQPLLADLLREKPAEDDISALLSILKDFVEERQRIEEGANKTAQKLKDEQRRADELQQKLDALKNIEKTMIERGQGMQK